MSDTAFPYQDASLAISARIEDLLARMTLADKAGLMFQPPIQVADDLGTRVMGSLSNRDLLERRITHANVVATRSAREMAAWHNALQREASEIGLGIPFIAAAFAVRPFMRILKRFRPHLATMEKVLGGFLVLTGILFLTNSMTLIAGWILEMFPGLAKIG